MKRGILILAVLAMLTGCKSKEDTADTGVFYDTDQFVMGADLSYVNQILDMGGEYSDSGIVENPYKIFSQYGTNVVRLRLWHNPQWIRDVYNNPQAKLYSGFDDVKQAIAESKSNGMKVCLDFHYSDNWADPSKQVVPAAWEGLNLEELRDSLYNYTYNTLEKLGNLGLMPEFVQVGNEINPGFLLPQGSRWNNNEDNFIYLLNAAIDAVRDAGNGNAIKPEIIVHVAQPENIVNWFTGLQGMHEFDIIGMSYYYLWSSIPLDQLAAKIAELKSLYGKDVMVVETGFPFTTNNADSYGNIIDVTKQKATGYDATVAGQYDYLVALTQEIIDGGGRGIIYWEPAWITSAQKTQWGTGSAWDCNAMFSFSGDVIKGMNYMTNRYKF